MVLFHLGYNPAVLILTFLQHCPGQADLLASPVPSRAPCHLATWPPTPWLPACPAAVGSGAFALVLTLALVGCVTPAERKCLLSGSWRSDTGCRMVVSVLSKDGSFSGSYLLGPADSDSKILTSPLEGSQQDAGLVPQPTFSFTVWWRLRDPETARTTAFLGQCYVGTNGGETLHALWLLREAANSPAEDWKATRIGTSIFTRIK
ncbi:avidin-like [Gavia stellata]|uniref:avidin-like n=1 Tax=Gavia stellata TaxID=37040 RepID=UPI00289A8207|nr:avidin-like [Gavia stellata]